MKWVPGTLTPKGLKSQACQLLALGVQAADMTPVSRLGQL